MKNKINTTVKNLHCEIFGISEQRGTEISKAIYSAESLVAEQYKANLYYDEDNEPCLNVGKCLEYLLHIPQNENEERFVISCFRRFLEACKFRIEIISKLTK